MPVLLLPGAVAVQLTPRLNQRRFEFVVVGILLLFFDDFASLQYKLNSGARGQVRDKGNRRQRVQRRLSL